MVFFQSCDRTSKHYLRLSFQTLLKDNYPFRNSGNVFKMQAPPQLKARTIFNNSPNSWSSRGRVKRRKDSQMPNLVNKGSESPLLKVLVRLRQLGFILGVKHSWRKYVSKKPLIVAQQSTPLHGLFSTPNSLAWQAHRALTKPRLFSQPMILLNCSASNIWLPSPYLPVFLLLPHIWLNSRRLPYPILTLKRLGNYGRQLEQTRPSTPLSILCRYSHSLIPSPTLSGVPSSRITLLTLKSSLLPWTGDTTTTMSLATLVEVMCSSRRNRLLPSTPFDRNQTGLGYSGLGVLLLYLFITTAPRSFKHIIAWLLTYFVQCLMTHRLPSLSTSKLVITM